MIAGDVEVLFKMGVPAWAATFMAAKVAPLHTSPIVATTMKKMRIPGIIWPVWSMDFFLAIIVLSLSILEVWVT